MRLIVGAEEPFHHFLRRHACGDALYELNCLTNGGDIGVRTAIPITDQGRDFVYRLKRSLTVTAFICYSENAINIAQADGLAKSDLICRLHESGQVLRQLLNTRLKLDKGPGVHQGT